MPFDESHLFRGALDYVANQSAIGSIIINPIWFSIGLVVIIILILLYVGWDDGPTFKLVFYLLAAIGCSVFIHDAIVMQNNIEQNDSSAITDLVTDIQNNGEKEVIQPRQEIPNNLMVGGSGELTVGGVEYLVNST